MRNGMQEKIWEHLVKRKHEKVNGDPEPRFDGDR
jgi:hypothetical protein